MDKLLNNKYLFFIVILIFTGFKIGDFNLPYYWDEAWSYMPAIWEMANEGPSMMPNSISPELYRGHPLFFYFLTSSWVAIFGESIWITRILPFFISILLLFSIHRLMKKIFDLETAVLTVIFFSIQSVFIAQSTYLLPEVLLTLLTVLAIEAYFEGNKKMTVLWLTIALFTKETAIVLWIAITCFEILQIFKNKQSKSLSNEIKSTSYLSIPIVLIAGFFMLQKIMVGWFFFPDHMSYVKFSGFFDKFEMINATTFIYNGRNLLTIIGAAALIYLSVKKREVLKEKKEVLQLALIFTFGYLLFSTINFFTPRYLLSILPFSIACFIFFIKEVLKGEQWLFATVLLIIFSNNLFFTLDKRNGYDHDLGGGDVIRLHSEMAVFCESQNFQHKSIASNFLMRISLTENRFGYLKEGVEFTNIDKPVNKNTELVILSSIEIDKSYYEGISQFSGKLLKRFERKDHWIEIYEFPRN